MVAVGWSNYEILCFYNGSFGAENVSARVERQLIGIQPPEAHSAS